MGLVASRFQRVQQSPCQGRIVFDQDNVPFRPIEYSRHFSAGELHPALSGSLCLIESAVGDEIKRVSGQTVFGILSDACAESNLYSRTVGHLEALSLQILQQCAN